MSVISKIQDVISFLFFGKFIDENKLNAFEKTGNRLIHILAFSWAIFIHEIYEPKVLVTGMSGRNAGNDLMTVITCLFLTVTLVMISDVRSKDRKMNNNGTLKYYVRSVALIICYSTLFYWLFFTYNLINYGVVHFSPFDVIRIHP